MTVVYEQILCAIGLIRMKKS